MATHAFSVKEVLKFGWETFKKDPWFYVGVTFALSLFSIVVNSLTGDGGGGFGILGFLISLLASTVVTIAYARLALSAAGGAHVGWEGLWAPEYFLNVLVATILQSVIIIVGLVLLIIPGIVVALMLSVTILALVDKKLNPIEALKESYRLTKGHLLDLLLLMVAILLLNIVGLLALFVGLLVTLPISLITMAHVYRKLSSLQEPALVQNVAAPH